MSFKACRLSVCVCVGGMVVRKILWFECVTMSWSVSAGHDCLHRLVHTHTNTYMQTFLSALYASHMVFIDPCPCYTPPAPSLSLRLSVCADGGGMMECWRVNLWFPGSWSGFIRSGCDNTRADGPTKRLSYKRRSANKKPSWKK